MPDYRSLHFSEIPFIVLTTEQGHNFPAFGLTIQWIFFAFDFGFFTILSLFSTLIWNKSLKINLSPLMHPCTHSSFSQYRQHFMSQFFANFALHQKLTNTKGKDRKAAHKMLVKLTPWNFLQKKWVHSIIQAIFCLRYFDEKIKKTFLLCQ